MHFLVTLNLVSFWFVVVVFAVETCTGLRRDDPPLREMCKRLAAVDSLLRFDDHPDCSQ